MIKENIFENVVCELSGILLRAFVSYFVADERAPRYSEGKPYSLSIYRGHIPRYFTQYGNLEAITLVRFQTPKRRTIHIVLMGAICR